MLLRTSSTNSSTNALAQRAKKMLPVFLLFALIACIAAVYGDNWWASFQRTFITPPSTAFCDAEVRRDKVFVHGKYTFGNAHTQSEEQAFSGTYSCKLTKKQAYGFVYEMPPIAGQWYKASVWRYVEKGKTGGYLSVKGKSNSNGKFYQQSETVVAEKDGWQQLSLTFQVPLEHDLAHIRVYPYITGNTTTYFDDLLIEPLIIDTSFDPATIKLELGNAAVQKIETKRREALRKGLLISEADDWVNAKINLPTGKIKSELRLKGDWLDHLRGHKWSFRIKVADPHAWNRLKTFSVQNPVTRNFLHEWVLHQLFTREDVLSPRYDFIQLQLNNKKLGCYAYEEHFEKQLPEYKNRREGPIIRFSEDMLWTGRWEAIKSTGKAVSPANALEAAAITPFKTGKTLKSPKLREQFVIAQNLLAAFRNTSAPAENIFDIPLLAKYYAIVDVMNAHHGLIWHNQRFYYNPVTSRLEPIGFDGYGGKADSWIQTPFLGYGAYNDNFGSEPMFKALFRNDAFTEQYIHYLHKFSDPNYLQAFFDDIYHDILVRQRFLNQEFDASFDAQKYVKKAKNIRLQLYPQNEHSLHAHRQNEQEVQLTNYHPLPLQILGFSPTLDGEVTAPSTSLPYVFAYNKYHPAPSTTLSLPANMKYIHFKVPGIDKKFYSPILDWPAPNKQLQAQAIQHLPLNLQSAVYTVVDSVITFSGKHSIKQNIVIPTGYTVYFLAGTQLDFINKAAFISYSPLHMQGTNDAPIQIQSSDHSANGFTVLQANSPSQLTYVAFEHLNTLSHKGWTLTGAVNFYESEVHIQHCTFGHNHCEDALNLIRSKFTMTNCAINTTFADGFDADFCKGKVVDSRFTAIGNDAIDFSGSVITLDNCIIDKTGDKGISVGEQSTVNVKSASISNSPIGVAAKDLSQLNVQTIILNSCEKGFTAYQKKPEYGGATIYVKDYQADDITYLHVIEPGSFLGLKGQKIRP